ncbi:MAG: hypothetical protein ACI80I_002025, partial [Akkermansiaceae bacterium]
MTGGALYCYETVATHHFNVVSRLQS